MTSISDTNVVNAPGGLVELGYVENDNYVTLTATSSASPDWLTPEVTVICDGSPVLVEYYAPIARATQDAAGTGDQLNFSLVYDGSVQEDSWGRVANRTNAIGHLVPVTLQYRMTPAAGSHTFRVGGYVSNAARNGYVGAGTPYPPQFLRVSKIIQASQLIVQTPNAPLVTSLPSNAIDGQEVRYLADNTNGIIWNLRYRAGSSSAYKWEFIGGPSLSAFVSAVGQQTTTSTFQDLSGPTITLPLAGDYDLYADAGLNDPTNSLCLLTISINGTAISYFTREYNVGYNGFQTSIINRATSLTASTVVRPQYWTSVAQSAGFGWGNSHITAIPIRVSA